TEYGLPSDDDEFILEYVLVRGCERGTVRRCAACRTGPGALRRCASLSTTPSPVPAWSAAGEGCSGERNSTQDGGVMDQTVRAVALRSGDAELIEEVRAVLALADLPLVIHPPRAPPPR